MQCSAAPPGRYINPFRLSPHLDATIRYLRIIPRRRRLTSTNHQLACLGFELKWSSSVSFSNEQNTRSEHLTTIRSWAALLFEIIYLSIILDSSQHRCISCPLLLLLLPTCPRPMALPWLVYSSRVCMNGSTLLAHACIHKPISSLSGIMTLQTYMYFQNWSRDRLFLRFVVATLWYVL